MSKTKTQAQVDLFAALTGAQATAAPVLQELPMNWVWATIGEVCSDPQYGWTTSASKQGSVKFLRTTDITSGVIDWKTVPYCDESPEKPEKYLLEDGDIVISRAGSVGFSHKIESPDYSVFASYLIRFRPVIDSDFVSLFLKSPYYWSQIRERSSGIALQNVNASKLKEIPIPIPPLLEQKRIVTKLEEILSELENGVSTLKIALAKVKRYRQSVLKAAVQGDLSKTWRETNAGKLEPASTLLERVLLERRERWEAEQKVKGRKNAKYLEPQAPDLGGLPELPESWVWTSLGEVFSVHVGSTPSRKELSYWGGSIPWVSSGEVSFCRIRKTRETITQAGLENSSTQILKPGTVLLGMIGEGKTRGQAAILEISATHNQNSASIRVSETPVPPEFVYYYLEYCYLETRRKGSGGNQLALNKSIVEKITLPLPPLEEQAFIVSQVEAKLSAADHLERTISTNLKRAERLRQSTLKKAFAGKLVAQDPTDEPASVLLERIRALREGVTAGRGKKKLTKEL